MLNLNWNGRRPRYIPLLGGFACCMLAGLWLSPVSGQTKAEKKTPASKKASAPSGIAAQNEFGFGSTGALPKDPAEIELDQSESGRQSLDEVQTRGKEIFEEREEIDRQRLPLVRPRDRLLEESAALRQGIVAANQQIAIEQAEINRLTKLAANGQNVNSLILQCNSNIFVVRNLITSNQIELTTRNTEITKLNAKIEPYDKELAKLLVELFDGRKKWLEIRQPLAKYALGDFDSLKRSLDEWLAFDALWPDAYGWAALCEYELGDYETAWKHLDKAEDVRKSLNYAKAWPKGEALRGLIAARLPDRRGKAAGHLQSAAVFSAANKNPDWQVQFLIGRAGMESERTAAKAKAGFTRALKINPDAAAVKFWYAKLQTTSVTPAARDVEQGIKTLEELWEQSTKKSWRLALALVLAYDAYDRKSDAEQLWTQSLALAPKPEHEKLKAARDEAREKLKSLTTAPTTTKAKTEKPKKPEN